MSLIKILRLPVACCVAGCLLAGEVLQNDRWLQDNQLPNVQQGPRHMNARGMRSPVTDPLLRAEALRARDIRAAMNRAVAFLRQSQAEDGSIEEGMVHYSTGAGTVMAALAMLASGADPVSDAPLVRALDWLRTHPQENTYFRAVRANVWQYALRRSPDDPEFKAALEADYAWLMEALAKKEGWRYLKNSNDWDNSVTQYGVLGVWAAKRAGLEPGVAFWQRMSEHFLSCQRPDGGWSYQNNGSSTANMVTAGLATMFLVFDNHHGRQFFQSSRGNPFAEGDAAACLKSIDRAMAWLAEHGGDNNDGYYLYGIERAGVASGRKYIGGRDWFREGAASILGAQRGDGSVPMRGYGNVRVNTAFATLFLVYGGAPVAFNKLEYGDKQEWNLNPRDVANLSKHLWAAYEQPLNWFSVRIDAPVEEYEAPILFISGADSVSFSEAQVATLRQYVVRGGMIFAEPADHSPAFRASMVALLNQLYPAETHPGRRLQPLPANHDIYTVLTQDWEARPELEAATMGSRVFFVLSDHYLAKDWQMNRTETDAFKLAMNLLFYATDRGSLHPRLQSLLPNHPPVATVAGAELVTARLRPAAGDRDLAAAWVREYAPVLSHLQGYKLIEREPLKAGDPIPEDVRLLVLTGQGDPQLDAAAAEPLRAFLKAGGTLLVDTWGGDPAFATSARTWVNSQLGALEPLPDRHRLVAGRFVGGADLGSGVRYTLAARRRLRAENGNTQAQQLEAVMLDGRPAVLFSPYGLIGPVTGARDFGAATYQPTAARSVLGNICGYLLRKEGGMIPDPVSDTVDK